MKQFSCGDVVPGCTAQFEAATEQQLFEAIALHAQRDHQMTEIPQSLVLQVQSKIRDISKAN